MKNQRGQQHDNKNQNLNQGQGKGRNRQQKKHGNWADQSEQISKPDKHGSSGAGRQQGGSGAGRERG